MTALLAAALLLAPAADALDPERRITQYKHSRWTVADGAPPIIYALAQGADGYLWIGSSTGLHRFDGVSFEHIPMQGAEREAVGRVGAVLAARDGTIWVEYGDSDIAAYRGGVLRRDASYPRVPDAYAFNILETPDGAIWVALSRQERAFLRRHRGRWEEIGESWGLPPEPLIDVITTRDGALWAATFESVVVLRNGARRFERVATSSGPAALSEDPAGRIWLSNNSGSRIISGLPPGQPGVTFPTPQFPLFVTLARFDRNGNLWGVNGQGIFRLRAPAEALGLPPGERAARVERFTARDGLTADTTQPLLEDREGNIWVGTTLGLDQFRDVRVVTEPQLTGFSATGGFGLFGASSGTVYVGTADALYAIAPGGAPQLLARLPSPVDQICEGAEGDIWAFSGAELLRVRRGAVTRGTLPSLAAVRRRGVLLKGCAVDRSGTLWLNGTGAGLYSLAAGAWRHRPPATDAWALSMIEDRREGPLVWLTSGMLAHLDDAGRPARVLLRRDTPGVYFLHRGRRDVLLGGAFGLGRVRDGRLQMVDPGRFPWLTDSHGMVDTPEGETWLIGRAGIIGVATADLERAFDDPGARLQPTILSFQDGLPNVRNRNSQNGVVRGGDGRLWFATVGGVVWVDPARLHRNALPPPVHIRGLAASGVQHRDPTRLTLARGTTSLAIQYAGLTLTVPERMRFRYRLEGVDENWVESGNRREAFYTNLGAGTYRFQVVAANDDGVWNTEGATLDFTIPPTFLQSIWFKLLCVLAAGLLLWLLYLVRVRQVAGGIRLALEQRLAERERIARELHDTLLQSVQGLILRFQSAADRLAPGDPARRPIEGALDRANDVLIEGRERVRALRSDAATHDLPQALRDLAADAITGDAPRFALTVEGARRPLHALASEELQRIAEEAIRNALQHAGATRIEAILSYGHHELGLTIRDDGTGIPDEVLRTGTRDGHYGLTGMRERAERIGGRLVVTSTAGQGTALTLAVPARAAYRGRRGGLIARLRGAAPRVETADEPESAPA